MSTLVFRMIMDAILGRLLRGHIGRAKWRQAYMEYAYKEYFASP